MDNKDIVIIGLVVLLVVAVLFSTGVFTGTTGKAFGTNYVCFDSDKNANIDMQAEIQGYVEGTGSNGQYFKMYDQCPADGSNKVIEYTCNPTTASGYTKNEVSCTNGCSNGACL